MSGAPDACSQRWVLSLCPGDFILNNKQEKVASLPGRAELVCKYYSTEWSVALYAPVGGPVFRQRYGHWRAMSTSGTLTCTLNMLCFYNSSEFLQQLSRQWRNLKNFDPAQKKQAILHLSILGNQNDNMKHERHQNVICLCDCNECCAFPRAYPEEIIGKRNNIGSKTSKSFYVHSLVSHKTLAEGGFLSQ